MTTVLHPIAGYPFSLLVSVEYELDDAGLTVTTTATNVGTFTLPYGCGQHPYLSAGTGLIDDLPPRAVRCHAHPHGQRTSAADGERARPRVAVRLRYTTTDRGTQTRLPLHRSHP